MRTVHHIITPPIMEGGAEFTHEIVDLVHDGEFESELYTFTRQWRNGVLMGYIVVSSCAPGDVTWMPAYLGL